MCILRKKALQGLFLKCETRIFWGVKLGIDLRVLAMYEVLRSTVHMYGYCQIFIAYMRCLVRYSYES
jgi:hypothetical protein